NMNWNIPPGTNYRLAPVSYTGIGSLMFQSTGGPVPVYPYTLAGVVSITNSTYGGALHPEVYYYFYNWSVSTFCESARTGVTASVTFAPPINVVAADPAICPGSSTNVSVNSLNDPNYTYSWTSNPAGFSASGTGPH